MAAANATSVDVEKFLDENGIKEEREGWRSFILEDDDIRRILEEALKEKLSNRVPKREWVLRALKYRKPSEIKVVIIGNAVIGNPDLATGLAFSMPPHVSYGDIRKKEKKKSSVRHLQEALHKAGLRKEPKDDTSCCLEDWAKRGVLLLNAELNYNQGEDSKWFKFLALLLGKFMVEHKAVYYFLWGAKAEKVFSDAEYESIAFEMEKDSLRDGVKRVKTNTVSQSQSLQQRTFKTFHPTYDPEPSAASPRLPLFKDGASEHLKTVSDKIGGESIFR